MNGRVSVAHRTCQRHGLCLAVAPDAFVAGPDGRIAVRRTTSPEALEQARQAARLCPLQAIVVRP